MPIAQDPRLAGRVAFTHPDFVSYTLARFFIVLSLEMQSVAVGWQVYEITKRPLDLGYVGLAQFLPGFVLFLFAGHAADLYVRRIPCMRSTSSSCCSACSAVSTFP